MGLLGRLCSRRPQQGGADERPRRRAGVRDGARARRRSLGGRPEWDDCSRGGGGFCAEGCSDGEPAVPRGGCGVRQHDAASRSGGRRRCEERRGADRAAGRYGREGYMPLPARPAVGSAAWCGMRGVGKGVCRCEAAFGRSCVRTCECGRWFYTIY